MLAASWPGRTTRYFIGMFATGGYWLTGQIDQRAQLAGGLIGALLGLFAGFAGVYVRYRDL